MSSPPTHVNDDDPQGKGTKKSRLPSSVIGLLLLSGMILGMLSYVNNLNAPQTKASTQTGAKDNGNVYSPPTLSTPIDYRDRKIKSKLRGKVSITKKNTHFGSDMVHKSEAVVTGNGFQYGWKRDVKRHLKVYDPPCTWSLDRLRTEGLADYPQHFPIMNVMSNWSPDVPEEPEVLYDSICRFNFSEPAERERAQFFREKERPFIVLDVPNIEDVRKLWTWEFLKAEMPRDQTVEVSDDNHLMFWRLGGKQTPGKKDLVNWVAPTKKTRWPFQDWKDTADKAEREQWTADQRHFYLIAPQATWAERDLTMFSPKKKSFFVVEPNKAKGVHCRFGMRGVIAESHYDGGRNMVAMVKGAKRYILASPKECKNMLLYPSGHPSSRHTKVDFGNVDDAYLKEFQKGSALEVILKAGEVLYIPSYWFHHIVSLSTSLQCNARSGYSKEPQFQDAISECGFSP